MPRFCDDCQTSIGVDFVVVWEIEKAFSPASLITGRCIELLIEARVELAFFFSMSIFFIDVSEEFFENVVLDEFD